MMPSGQMVNKPEKDLSQGAREVLSVYGSDTSTAMFRHSRASAPSEWPSLPREDQRADRFPWVGVCARTIHSSFLPLDV